MTSVARWARARPWPAGDDVLVEPELTGRADDAEELAQGTNLVGHRAQHERNDARIELPVFGR